MSSPSMFVPAVVIVLVAALLLFGMWRGWRHRVAEQSSMAAPANTPSSLTVLRTFDGAYVATTAKDDPLDRIVAHDLGPRGNAQIVIATEGVLVERDGQDRLFVPRSSLTGVGRTSWTIDRAVESNGLIVFDWTLGEAAVSTVLRLRHAADTAVCVEIIQSLLDDGHSRSSHDV